MRFKRILELLIIKITIYLAILIFIVKTYAILHGLIKTCVIFRTSWFSIVNIHHCLTLTSLKTSINKML